MSAKSYVPWITGEGYAFMKSTESSFQKDTHYVRHADYARLLASHGKLVEALKKMRSDVNRSDYHTRRTAFEKADAALREAEAITKE